MKKTSATGINSRPGTTVTGGKIGSSTSSRMPVAPSTARQTARPGIAKNGGTSNVPTTSTSANRPGGGAKAFIQQQKLAARMAASSISGSGVRESGGCTDTIPLPMIKAAKKSGQLNLSNRGLASIPSRVWCLNEADDGEKKKGFSVDVVDEEENWWECVDMTKLILASNQITCIPADIQKLTALTVLDLHDNALTSLPDEIGKLENLIKLNLNHNQLTTLPMYFFDLTNLQNLNICHNKLESLDEDISRLNMLQDLDVSHNQLSELPSGISCLTKVSKLVASHNNLDQIPPEIAFMRCLKLLDLSNNKLTSLPDSTKELAAIEQLFLQYNELESLPQLKHCQHLKELHVGFNRISQVTGEDIDAMANQLKVLDLRDNKIEVLPDEIVNLQSLERLDVSNNNLSILPFVLGTLPHLKNLQCDGNPMKSIRRDIIQRGTVGLMKYLRLRINDDDLAKLRERGNVSPSNSPISSSPPVPDKFSMKTSQTINMSKKELSSLPEEAVQNGVEAGVIGVDLSHNQLTAFPDNIEPLIGKLFEMNLSHNKLTQVGSMLGMATQLQYLNLSNNRLDDLPSELSSMVNLREIAISFNRFKVLPKCLNSCTKMETLVANGNQISEIPVEDLGSLPMLAVLDLSNNDIQHVPPLLGRVTQIRTLQLEGNPFRVPRPQILVQGTQSIMQYLRNRIPADGSKEPA